MSEKKILGQSNEEALRTHVKSTAQNNPNRRQWYSWGNSTKMTGTNTDISHQILSRMQEAKDKLIQPLFYHISDLFTQTHTPALAGATAHLCKSVGDQMISVMLMLWL